MAQSGDSRLMKPPPPRFAMITPSASPPVSRSASKKPAKRPRLSSTPARSSSSGSRATPLAADLTQDALHDLRRASSQRVLSIWESLAERYAKALDEDDIVDLRHGILVKDRGVVRSKEKMPIGYFAGDDQEEVASTAGPEGRDTAEEEAGTDMDPLDAFAPDDSVPKEFELEKDRRKVPPVQVLDPMDADDLKEFLEAEKQRREVCGVDEEDEDEDALDVVEALENGGWETTDGEDLVGSEEGDSEASDLPPSDVDPAPSEPIRRVQAERALTIADGSDSEDELLKWSDDEAFVVPRTQPFNADFIDLTTPSPPSSPIKPDQPKSSTKARTPSTAPSHAKSKTPAARRVQPIITPPSSPPSMIQLRTPPRSQSQSSSPIFRTAGIALPSPLPVAVSKSTPRPRPKPTPTSKRLSQSESLAPSPIQYTTSMNQEASGRGRSSTSNSYLVAEVVLPARPKSRARSLAAKEPSIDVLAHIVDTNPSPPSTPRRDKGKARAMDELPGEVPPSAPIDDSPSPPKPQRWKPKFQRTFATQSQAITPVSGPNKRKRLASSSPKSIGPSPESSSGGSFSSAPLSQRPRTKKPPLKAPAKPKAKTGSASKATAKAVNKVNDEKSDERPPSRSRTSEPRRNPMYPYPMPYTPHHGDDPAPPPQYPNPPMLPIQDPQAQYYFAQAVQHLSYLMSGALPPPTGYAPPFPIPKHYQLPKTPQHHRRRDDPLSDSSPAAGPSSSHAIAQTTGPFSTPHHQPYPYPFSFDPAFSSGSLPPSSPLPSSSPIRTSPSPSPSPSPVPERRSALVRGRSRSRGRRVSFKLDDNERPRVQGEEEEEDMDADTSMRTVHMSSPEHVPVRGRSSSRGRVQLPSPTKSSGKSKRIAVAEEPASDQIGARGPKSDANRGRTPGPSSSTARKK